MMVTVLSSRRYNSPWANDDSEIKCPKCGSTRIVRVLNRWAMNKGVQIFECSNCGKKFYDRGYDDYRPTFER